MKRIIVMLLMASLLLMGGCFSEKEDNDDQRNAAELVYPKGVISGVVVDDITKQPLAGVKISLGKAMVTTDRDGNFSVSGLDIGGANRASFEDSVIYNLVSTKENYVNNCATVEFTKDTLQNDDTQVEINISATGDITSGGEELLIGQVVLPLGNATATIKIEMVEKVTVLGKVKAAAGFNLGDMVKVKATIPINLPESNFTNQISQSQNFSIKDVPTYEHLYLGLEVFTDEDDYADFYYENEVLELRTVKREGSTGQRIANLGEIVVMPYCTVTGTVFTKYDKVNSITKGAKVELYKGISKVGEALTTESGVYTIKGIKPGTYELRLLDFDENSDGQLEYVNGKSYADVVVLYGADENLELGSTASTTISRDLWYEGAYNYSIEGKVEAGLVGNTFAGITVKAVYENGSEIEVLAETETEADGTFTLEGIQFKNVSVIAEAIDIDGNAIANFTNASYGLVNDEDQNVVDVNLFMGVNVNDPSYDLEVEETNFSEYIVENLSTKLNAILPDENLVIKFNKAISQESINYIESHIGEKLVILTSGPEELEIVASFDETRTILTINPSKALIADYYTVSFNNRLATEDGYKFRVFNNINDLGVDVAIENYVLKLSNLNFATKDRTGMWNKELKLLPDSNIVITFAEAVSMESVTAIEMKNQSIVNFVPHVEYTYSFDETNTILTIEPVEYLSKTGTDQFGVFINRELSSTNGFMYEVGNAIQDLELNVDLEPYQLKIVSGSFIEKDINTGNFKVTTGLKDRVLTLTFNMPISQNSMNDILNDGNIVAAMVLSGKILGKTNVSLSADRLTMTLNPEVAIEKELDYSISLNPELMSEAGYTYEVTITGQTAFNGKLLEAINIESLSAIKPELIIPDELLGTYNAGNLYMDWNMANWFAKSALSLEKDIMAYDINTMPISIDINPLKSVIDQVSRFEVYAKTDLESSYWTKVKSVTSWTMSDVKLGKIETSIDLDAFMDGYMLDPNLLAWGQKLYFTVLPVDELGKKANLPVKTAAEVLVFADNTGVELAGASVPNYGSIFNGVSFTEMIDPEATWNISVSGENSNIGAVISNEEVTSSLTAIRYQIDAGAVFTTSVAYNISTATSNDLTINTTDGLYDGMILETELGKIVVTNIKNTSTIEFGYASTPFDIVSGTEFKINRDNADLYTRMDSTSVYNATQYGTGAIFNIAAVNIDDIDGDVTNGGRIVLAGTNPLLGLSVGNAISFKEVAGAVTTTTTLTITTIEDKNTFTTITNLENIIAIDAAGTAVATTIYQLALETSALINGRSLELEHVSDESTKIVNILALDDVNDIVKINLSPENYTARASLVSIDTANKKFIANDIRKYTVGDRLFLNKDSSIIKESDSNVELEITAVVPVTTVAGIKKYEYTVNEINRTLSDVERGYAVEFNPTFKITLVAQDGSGNLIRSNHDEIYYNIFESAWMTK